MNQIKSGWIVMLFFMVINGNAQNLIFVEQVSREKAFIKSMEELIKCPGILDYKDRTSLSKNIKPKLIVSDLKINPIFNGIYESENYIIVPYSEILKSKAEIYLLPKDISISKDSCSIEFEIINKFNHTLIGNFKIIPDKPSMDYDVTAFTTKVQMKDINSSNY